MCSGFGECLLQTDEHEYELDDTCPFHCIPIKCKNFHVCDNIVPEWVLKEGGICFTCMKQTHGTDGPAKLGGMEVFSDERRVKIPRRGVKITTHIGLHWVYILECEKDVLYVGTTTRLFRRFWEHINGNGGINTSKYNPKKIVAIYKVDILGQFFECNYRIDNNMLLGNIYFNRNIIENFNTEICDYDHLKQENNIAEKLMIDNPNMKIRGGKYVRDDCNYKFPQNIYNDLPNCKCGLPCDIHQNTLDKYLYFRCAKKNIWEEMQEEFDTDNSCNFFMKYTKYNEDEQLIYGERIKKLTYDSKWLEYLAGGHYEYCIGGCGKEYDGDNTVRYKRKAINLCFDCFINKNNELQQKYDKQDIECLID